MLGYHIGSEDKSMECYSRDSMADPLRALDRVLAAISAGTFSPDATRSGMITEPADPASEAEAAEMTSSCSTSSSSSSSSPSSLAFPGDNDTEIDYAGKFVINNATNFVHICKDIDGMHCGKPWPDDHDLVEDVPPGGQKCPGCF